MISEHLWDSRKMSRFIFSPSIKFPGGILPYAGSYTGIPGWGCSEGRAVRKRRQSYLFVVDETEG